MNTDYTDFKRGLHRLNMGEVKMFKSLKVPKLISVFIFILSFILYPLPCFSGPGVTGATFLKLGVGSRPAAMGEAYAGIADDVTAIYWNPAGLAQIKNMEVSLIYTDWFQTIYHSYLGFCQPAFGGTIGIAGTLLWIDGIERRTGDTVNPDGWLVARDVALSLAYAKPITKPLNVGATLKILYNQLDDKTATGLAVDIGLLYNMSQDMKAGLAIQNLGYQSAFITEQYALPINIKAGISKGFPASSLILAADVNYCLFDNIFTVGVGTEWWIHPVFAIRGGYKYNTASTPTLGPLSGLTCGIGFKVGVISIDYAFVPYGDLGFTNRVSMLARL